MYAWERNAPCVYLPNLETIALATDNPPRAQGLQQSFCVRVLPPASHLRMLSRIARHLSRRWHSATVYELVFSVVSCQCCTAPGPMAPTKQHLPDTGDAICRILADFGGFKSPIIPFHDPSCKFSAIQRSMANGVSELLIMTLWVVLDPH